MSPTVLLRAHPRHIATLLFTVHIYWLQMTCSTNVHTPGSRGQGEAERILLRIGGGESVLLLSGDELEESQTKGVHKSL